MAQLFLRDTIRFHLRKNAFLRANNIDYHIETHSRCDRQRGTGTERKCANGWKYGRLIAGQYEK